MGLTKAQQAKNDAIIKSFGPVHLTGSDATASLYDRGDNRTNTVANGVITGSTGPISSTGTKLASGQVESGNVSYAGPGDSQLTQLQKIQASGGLNPSQQSLYDQLTKNAQMGNNASLQAIQAKLDLVRKQAQDQLDNASSSRDYVVNFINQRYPELQNRVEQQRTNTLQDLGTQETDLQNLYDRANATARKRSEDVALQNRNAARAGNRLGSSFYDQAVQSNQENLGQTLGASDLERIAKMAAIKTQKDRSNQDYNNTINDLDSQKNQATYSAIDEYNKAVQQANYLKQAGINDFGAGEAAAAQNLQSRLDSIAQWAQGVQQQQQALAAQYGTGGGFDTGLSGIANTAQSFLTQNAQAPQANALASYAPTTIATPQPANSNNQYAYANQGISSTDDLLKRLGLA